MKWRDGVTLGLAIDVTKREKGHPDHLRNVEKAEQTKTMMAR
jgi:hypothetical protein